MVGGGIAGVCAARDAALRGLRVVVLEQSDLASGTSSASLSVVHGGLRQFGNLALREARESAREQHIWQDIARHRVRPLEFIVPARSRRHAWMLRAAAAAGRRLLPAEPSPPGSSTSEESGQPSPDPAEQPCPRYLGRLETRSRAIRGLTDRFGSLLLSEAVVDSVPRLVIDLAADAAARGVEFRTRHEFASGRYDAASGLWRIHTHLTSAARTDPTHCEARYLINAAGTGAAEVAGRSGLDASGLPRCWVLGLNLILRRPPPAAAFGVPIADRAGAKRMSSRHRYLFVVPAAGAHTAIGTGYYAARGMSPGQGPDVDSFVARAAERFLHTVNAAVPQYQARRAEVILTPAGWLPSDPTNPRHPLSSDILVQHQTATSVVAVKFTTARLLAERAVDRCAEALGRADLVARSARVRLPGSPVPTARSADDPTTRPRSSPNRSGRKRPRTRRDPNTGVPELTDEQTARLEELYGERASEITGVMRSWPDWREPIIDDLVYGVFRYGVAFEWARSATDLTERRTFLAARGLDTKRVRYLAQRAAEGSDPE